MPTVGAYLSRSGLPNGDCGMVFERRCEISYDLDRGFARDCAQRCQVAEPSVLAIPISSPCPHRDGAVVFCASAPKPVRQRLASVHIKREVNIVRLPRYLSRTEQDRAVPLGVIKLKPMIAPNAVSDKGPS